MGSTKDVKFTGSHGHTLAGHLHMPMGKPRAFALFAHCFTCAKDLKAAVRITEALGDKGIATMRFDFTGLGESEGDFSDSNFSSNVQDLVAASDYLRDNHRAPTLLVGHSLGGAAALMAASQIPEATAVATIGAPCHPEHVSHLLKDAKDEIVQEGEALVELAGRSFKIKKQFLEDIKEQPMTEAIGNLKRALIVFHAPFDDYVDIDNARRIFQAAKHPKSFVSLDDADHLLRRAQDAQYVADVLAAWAQRYLPEPSPEEESEHKPGVLRISGNSDSLAQRMQAGRHHIISDEPENLGGGNLGPTPYELLLASLGSCTSMTLLMYSKHKKWPLDDVTISLSHDRIHAKDCEDCESKDGKIDVIERHIEVRGDLDDDQIKRLGDVANRCPVHKTLVGEIRIATDIEHKE